jgi:hypothetical protein
MSQRWTIKDQFSLDHFGQHCTREIAAGRTVTVEFVKPMRTDGQNNLLHQIIRDVAKQKQDENINEVKRFVKLHFGVPELRASDEKFRKRYDEAIRNTLTYEQKLAAMDVLPVTRDMDTEQLSRVIDAAISHYTQEGFDLTHLGKSA